MKYCKYFWLTVSLSIFFGCFGPSQSYPTTPQITFYTAREGNFEIYTMDINGFNQVNLSQHPGRDKYPQFSPDGSRIIFVSDRDGNYEIYIMELEWYGGYTRYKVINLINLSNQPGDDL